MKKYEKTWSPKRLKDFKGLTLNNCWSLFKIFYNVVAWGREWRNPALGVYGYSG